MLQPRFMNSTASQSSSSGCVGCSPILPKLSSVATMPRPKWWCQMRLTMTRAVSGFCAEPSHSASARRRPDVCPSAGGISVGGLPIVATRHEARLHQGAVALRIAANQEVRRRRLVSSRPCVQETAGEIWWDSALRTADYLIALSERREAVIAVRDDFGHRERRRTLFFELRDLRLQRPLPRELVGRQHLVDLGALDVNAALRTWVASSFSPGVRWSSGLRMALLTFSGYFARTSAPPAASDTAPRAWRGPRRSGWIFASSSALRRLYASASARGASGIRFPRSRRSTPAARSSPSAGSDRTCGCGSARN